MRIVPWLSTIVPRWADVFRVPVAAVPGAGRFQRLVLAILFVGCLLPGLSAADYYVSPTGSDANNGTAATSAWRTLAKVNSRGYKPGDRILLQGGQTFSTAQSGALVIRDVQATAASPLVLSSYGTGKARIQVPATAKNGVEITACSHLQISNLIVAGPGRTVVDTTIANRGSGISMIWVNDSSVDQVEVSGFQRNGLYLNGCHRLLVSGVYAHDNGFAGIYSEGDGIFTANNCSALMIRGCRAINNPGDPEEYNLHSGNGILLTNTVDSTIEYCEAANNGWDMHWTAGGPVGIWVASSSRIIIQHCISHDNKSSGVYDGGGFDLDSATTDSLLQYNYSYNNNGAGYLLYTNPGDRNSGNTVRYNISENDGAGCHKAGIYLGGQGSLSHTNTEIYHNIVVNSAGRHAIAGNSDYLPATVRVRNNLFLLRGTGRFMDGMGKAPFQGNLYWNYDGGGSWSTYSSLAQWRQATGNERLADGTLVGLHADPRMTGAGSGGSPTDPYQLSALAAYRLVPGSPALNAAINLRTSAGLAVGATDFFGHDLAQVQQFDIGAYELPRPSGLALSPATGVTTGGTVVTITGQDLQGTSVISFGGTIGTVQSNDGSRIVCLAPAHGAGAVDVNVTNPGGTSLGGRFTYVIPAPVITGATTAGGQAERAFTYQITATNDPTSFQALGLPSGLVVDAATGRISGSPGSAGTWAVTISCANAGGTASGTLTLTFTPSARTLANDFVVRLYQRCLNRSPDPVGLASWTSSLLDQTRSATEAVRGFVLGVEFTNRVLNDADFLEVLYQACFNRPADAGGKAAWQAELKRGVLREDVLYGFLMAPEFSTLCLGYGISVMDASALQRYQVRSFVRRFYQQCLNREPDQGGINAWVDGLLNGSLTGRDVGRGFFLSQEFVRRQVANSTFLGILYQSFFDRAADAGGLSTWSAALAAGATRSSVVDGFVSAQEFRQLCARYGIVPFPPSG